MSEKVKTPTKLSQLTTEQLDRLQKVQSSLGDGSPICLLCGGDLEWQNDKGDGLEQWGCDSCEAGYETYSKYVCMTLEYISGDEQSLGSRGDEYIEIVAR